MLHPLSAFLYRVACWKLLLPVIAVYILFPAYILKNLEAKMNAVAIQPVGPIDLLVGYNPARISQMITAYGPEGRAIYARGELTADIAYPIVYTFLFCLILSMLFRNRAYAPFRWVNVLPVGILLFDLLENTCTVYLLKSYPNESTAIASLCSVFTNLKWAVSVVVLGLILYGLARLAMGSRQRRLEQG